MIFDKLIDKSDLPANVVYTDFDYYFYLSDYSSIMDTDFIEKATDDSNSKVKNFSDAMYEYYWNMAKETLRGTSAENITKEEFKQALDE